MTQPYSDLPRSGCELLKFLSLFPFSPFLHKDTLGKKDPNTHIPAKALIWSPPNLLVKSSCPTGCRWAFGPASSVEMRTSLHSGEGLETSISPRLLRRSHLPSLALLSHTDAYICISESLFISIVLTSPLESTQLDATLPQCPVIAYLLPSGAASAGFVFQVNILHTH